MVYVKLNGKINPPFIYSQNNNRDYTIIINGPLEFGINNSPKSELRMKLNQNNNFEYNFQLVSTSTYNVTIETKNESRIDKTTFQIYIPYSTDETLSYELYNFYITNPNFTSQINNFEALNYIKDDKYFIQTFLDNKNFVVKDPETNEMILLGNFKVGGILNNNSFEYDLSNTEQYVFETIKTDNSASVDVSYSNDIYPFSGFTDLVPEEDTRSMELDITNTGTYKEDIILQHRLNTDKILTSKKYRLKFLFKYISGDILDDIYIVIKNSNGDLLEFTSLTLDPNDDSWQVYDNISQITDDKYLVNSSNELYLKVYMGTVGNVNIRLDEFKLTPYYEQETNSTL